MFYMLLLRKTDQAGLRRRIFENKNRKAGKKKVLETGEGARQVLGG